jgi:hypothetical protein
MSAEIGPWEIWCFRAVVVGFVGWFAAQMAARVRLIEAAPDGFSFDHPGARFDRFVTDVIFQARTIRGRPVAGVAHLLVFWGFCAFGGYTALEGLRGIGLVDLTHTAPARIYAWALVPFAVTVILGMTYLLIRRTFIRPPGLGKTLSKESVLIAFFIIGLMVTFLLTFGLEGGTAARVNWWVHMLIILTFLGLIPDSKHLHLMVSPNCRPFPTWISRRNRSAWRR